MDSRGCKVWSYITHLLVVYCKESTLSDNIWWHQPWRQGVPRSAILEEGGEVDSTGFLTYGYN